MNAIICPFALACAGLLLCCVAPISLPTALHAPQAANMTTAAGNATAAKAEKPSQKPRAKIVKNSGMALTAPGRSDCDTTGKPALGRKSTVEAAREKADAEADLATLAKVREEVRGTVITLSGWVLFASDQSTILKRALDQLSRVADALLEMKERRLTIDAFADASDSTNHKQELSQERANAVRSYLISLGYPGDLIQARGFGEKSPIAGNASAEGRADIRRVEIAISRVAR